MTEVAEKLFSNFSKLNTSILYMHQFVYVFPNILSKLNIKFDFLGNIIKNQLEVFLDDKKTMHITEDYVLIVLSVRELSGWEPTEPSMGMLGPKNGFLSSSLPVGKMSLLFICHNPTKWARLLSSY